MDPYSYQHPPPPTLSHPHAGHPYPQQHSHTTIPPYNNNNNEAGPSSSRLFPVNQYNHQMSRISSEGYESSDIEHKPSSGNKRKKKDSNGQSSTNNTDDRVKKTRQSQSCDACRARKVKCDRPPPGSSNTSAARKDICSHCEHLGLTCTFDYKPKKRGPPNMYMRKMQGEPGSTDNSPPPELPTPEKPSAPISSLAPGMPALSYPALAKQEPPSLNRSDLKGWEPTLASAQMQDHLPPHLVPPPPHGHHTHGHLLHPSYMDITRSATSSPEPHIRQFPPHPHPQSLAPLHQSAVPPPASMITGYNPGLIPNYENGGNSAYNSPQHSNHTLSNYPTPITSSSPRYGQQQSQQMSMTYNNPNQVKPLYMYVEHPYNPNNPIEKIIDRKMLYEIIDLYFDYIYCLIPCLHRPTFTHDLNTKREERPNETEWTALVLSIVASTLVQLPKNFVKSSRTQVKQLVINCHQKVREYMAADFETITINRTIIYYHSMFVIRTMGGIPMGKGVVGSLHAYLLALKAHDEKAYSLLNPLDRVLLRRSFWLMYGADKSISSIEATPVFFHEDDCPDVAFPEELDDEYITEQGYLPQPEGYTPILSGFTYISRLFRITGQVLDKHRKDKRKPPTGLLLQMRLNEVNELYEKTMTLMDHCPKSLRLEYRTGTRSVKSLSPGWDIKAKNDILAIFSDPNFDAEVVKDHYLVQQANIYVTQQQVRFMILQYRDELHELQLDQERENQTNQQYLGAPGAGSTFTNGQENTPAIKIQPWLRRNSAISNDKGVQEQEEVLVTSSAEKDEVICDLLAILQKIPLKVLAVNSFPIVQKVQFVASTLLDAIDPSAEGEPGFNPQNPIPTVLETRAQKAQRNLWQFLNILSEIEGLYSLEDDQVTL